MFQREQLNNIDIDKENSRPSTAGMSPDSHEVEVFCVCVCVCVCVYVVWGVVFYNIVCCVI